MTRAAPTPRRALPVAVATGLLTASAWGLLPGTAQASPMADVLEYANGVDVAYSVPSDVCAIAWRLAGGEGGEAYDPANPSVQLSGGLPGEVRFTAQVRAGDQFVLAPGEGGSNYGASSNTSARSGATASGGARAVGSNGTYGGGGGGAASALYAGTDTTGTPVALAAGGGGSSYDSAGGAGGATGSPGATASVSGQTYAGGGGASSTAHGAGGTTTDPSGVAGAAGAGHLGGAAPGRAGGGGGGWFAGGSGAADGVGSASDRGGAGGGGSNLAPAGATTNGTSTGGGGVVQGDYTLCAVPAAPAQLSVDAADHALDVQFVPATDTGTAVTGYQYSTDGSTWSTLATTAQPDGSRTGTITGLANGTSYGVQVRATHGAVSYATTSRAAGHGAASSTATATPTSTPAPRSVTGATATAQTSAVSVSWVAPSGGAPVTGYRVTATPGDATCTTTTTSCLLGAVAGTGYTVSVVSLGAHGESAPATATTGAAGSPVVPATVPTTALTLTTDQGRITRVATGQQVTVLGTGFLPHSTATIVVYSQPQVLATVTTDGAGDFSRPVTVPTDLAAGTHSLVASGVAPDGSPRFLRMDVEVGGGTGAGRLATTGFEATPWLLGGVVLLTAGAAATWTARRRA